MSHEGQMTGTKCFKCEKGAVRACTLCGKFFCSQHGGERWIWLDETGGRQGTRHTRTQRVICDDCTSNLTTRPAPSVFGIIMLIVILGFILYVFAALFNFWLSDKAKGRAGHESTVPQDCQGPQGGTPHLAPEGSSGPCPPSRNVGAGKC